MLGVINWSSYTLWFSAIPEKRGLIFSLSSRTLVQHHTVSSRMAAAIIFQLNIACDKISSFFQHWRAVCTQQTSRCAQIYEPLSYGVACCEHIRACQNHSVQPAQDGKQTKFPIFSMDSSKKCATYSLQMSIIYILERSPIASVLHITCIDSWAALVCLLVQFINPLDFFQKKQRKHLTAIRYRQLTFKNAQKDMTSPIFKYYKT